MGIISQMAKIKIGSKNFKHYKSLGYIFNTVGDEIEVKIADLPKSSKAKVYVQCDFCGEKKYIQYADFLRSIEKYDIYSCNRCLHYKTERTNLDRYGVLNYSSTMDCREKVKNSFLKYYGFENVLKSESIKDKIRNTNIRKYGCYNPMQFPEIRAKANETLCKNGTQKTSKQQLYLHSIYGGELNYFIKYYATDICFPEEKLIIEYNGGGHDLRVALGNLTQEEFDQKEITRNNILKREGYKRVSIVSNKDLLPSDQVLLKMISYARNYFSQYPNHSWIEFNIDNSVVYNAEHKGGILYDYGKLRKIK